MRVKAFIKCSFNDLEEEINSFLNNEFIKVVQISHSSMADRCGVFTALVLYEKRNTITVTLSDLVKEEEEYDRAQTAKD